MRRVLSVLGILIWSAGALAAATAPAAAMEDATSRPLLDQLTSTLFVRVAPEGRSYGLDQLDILYWQGTEHLLTEPSHSAAVRILDRFLRAHGERLVADPFRRAMLQRDLWELFDWVASPRAATYPPQRAELRALLARVIRRLALSDVEIAALPDNYAMADPHADLPGDLFAADGGWIRVDSDDSAFATLASRHTEDFNGHSVFSVMVRLPQGRQQTVDYLNSLRDFEGPLVYAQMQVDHHRRLAINPDMPQFPAGTQWALVRRMCLIDDQGQIRPTPLIESIQIRRYNSIEPLRGPGDFGPGGTAAQQLFEFDMQREREGALKALTLSDTDFQSVHFMSQGGDPFELALRAGGQPNPTADRHAALGTCHMCHVEAGIASVASFNHGRFTTQPVQRLRAATASPQQQIESTIAWKSRQFDWGLLQGLWQLERPD